MTSKAPAALAVALALAVGGVMPATAQGPIRIGASLSLTGTYAKLGKNQHEGYQLCEKDLNAKGGLLGRRVQFVVYDDQSMPATAVRLYEKLITEDKVDAIMGPYSSPVTEAAVNVTEKYKKVMVAPLAATTSIFKKGRKYIFMVISPAEAYLEGLADMAAKRGLKTVAVVNEDTLFSKAAAAGAVEIAKKKGLQVVFTEAYPKGNTDFSDLLTKVKATNPDVLAAATYFDDAVELTRQMKELNVNPQRFGVTVGAVLPLDGRLRRVPDLRGGGQAREQPGRRQGSRAAPEARDAYAVRRLQGRGGRLPGCAQDGDLPVAEGEEGHRLARRAGAGQAALPDATLDEPLVARRVRASSS